MLTPTRVLAASVALMLVVGTALAGSHLLPERRSLVTAESPPPTASVPPARSPSPGTSPEASVEPTPEMARQLSSFAATRTVAELEPGTEPADLARSFAGGVTYFDQSTMTVRHVADDGTQRVLAGQPIEGSRPTPTFYRSNALPGEWLVSASDRPNIAAYSEDGDLHVWRAWGFVQPVFEVDGTVRNSGNDGSSAERIPTDPFDADHFEVVAVDPADGSLHQFASTAPEDSSDFALESVLPPVRRDGRSQVLDLYLDPWRYLLTQDGVEVYHGTELVSEDLLEDRPGEPLDYRSISGIGADGVGELWLYDATSRDVDVYDKATGTYLRSWAPGPGQPAMRDVRGLVVDSGPDGGALAVTWITPTAVYRSANRSSVALTPSASPGPDAGWRLDPIDGSTATGRRLELHSGGIELTADHIQVDILDKRFTLPNEIIAVGRTYADQAELDLDWWEKGVHQRMILNLEVDDTSWWLRDLWVYDGKRNGDWIYFEGLDADSRTPIGSSLEGNLWLSSTGAERRSFRDPGTARLRIDGLRLTAFQPGTRPAPLTGCEYLVDDRVEIYREGGWTDDQGEWGSSTSDSPLAGPGEPLAGFKKMTPRQVEKVLKNLGLCYRFDYSWKATPRFKDPRLNRAFEGYFDRRCTAPRTGKVQEVNFGPDYPATVSGVVVYVTVEETKPRDWPEPPPQGTDCPSQ